MVSFSDEESSWVRTSVMRRRKQCNARSVHVKVMTLARDHTNKQNRRLLFVIVPGGMARHKFDTLNEGKGNVGDWKVTWRWKVKTDHRS